MLREKQELKWAPDSLFFEYNNDSSFTPIDSTQLKANPKKAIVENVDKHQLVKIDEKQNQQIQETEEQKKEVLEKETDVVSFSEPIAINLTQAFTLFNKGVMFIDARDEADFLAGHITKSINIPFDDFENHKQKLEQLSKEKPMVIYCAGTECDLSHLLANLLFEKGYKKVYVFFGGWIEWSDASYPVEHSSESN